MNPHFHSFIKAEGGWLSGGSVRSLCRGLSVSVCLMLGLALLTGGSAMAQAREVSARVSPAKIRVGGYATFSVIVEGGQGGEIDTPTLPEGLTLAGMGKSISRGTTINNGRRSDRYVQSWQITATKPGTYVIPAQSLQVDGRDALSNSVEVTVSEKGDAETSQFDPLMSIEVGKREFYVGEIVPITANLYVHEGTALRRVGLIELPKDNFAIQRFPLQGEESRTEIARVPYRVLTFQSTLSALRAGKFKLGPATSEVILQVPSANEPILHPMFMQTEPQKMNPQSNDVEVTILPLPGENRPKGFTGVVGDFEINMTATPTALAVGEPISVDVAITGTGNFDAIVAPGLIDQSNWKVYPPKRFNTTSPDVMMGGNTHHVGFNQVIIPQKQVTEIPSYEFSYFSPTDKKYVTLRTPPVPLQVRPAANHTPSAPEAVGSAATSIISPEKVAQATVNMTDILSGTTSSPVWLAAKPLPWRDQRFVMASAAAGGLLVLMLLVKGLMVMARNSANAPDAALKALWKQVKVRQQPAGQFYDGVARLIAAKGLAGPEVSEVLVKAEQFNYSREHEGATEPVAADERARVLRVLEGAKTVQG